MMGNSLSLSASASRPSGAPRTSVRADVRSGPSRGVYPRERPDAHAPDVTWRAFPPR